MNRIFGNLFPGNPVYYYALADMRPECMRGMKFGEYVRAMRYEIVRLGQNHLTTCPNAVKTHLSRLPYDLNHTRIGIMPFREYVHIHQVCGTQN